MKFKVGDLVWAEVRRSDYGLSPGDAAAVVLKILGAGENLYGDYIIEIEGVPNPQGKSFTASEPFLRPRKPPDEIKREELGSWDLCPWQPNKVTV